MTLTGYISNDLFMDAKFSISGTLTSVKVTVGQTVSNKQLLATLQSKELQAYLDRALKYYDAIRAEFDEKQKKGLSDYERIKIQSELDIAVKNVEIAKANLEAANLLSPISGVVGWISRGAPGLNITPSGFAITLIDPNSYFFEALVKEEDLDKVKVDNYAEVKLKAFKDKVIKGRVASIGLINIKEGQYPVKIVLTDFSDLRLGLSGEADILPENT